MKKILIAVALLVLLIAGVLIFAVTNANALAQRYKPDLERLSSNALGSTVTFGAISASVFPTAKLVVDQVTVTSDGESLTLENLTLKIALLPLLRRSLEIQTLELNRPNITVYLEEDGVFIAGLPRETPDNEAPAEVTDLPIDINLENLSLRDATITIKDAVAETEYVITGLNITAALDVQGNEVHLAQLDGSATILTDMDIDFRASNLTYALVGGALGIESMTAEAQGNTFTVTGGLDPADPARTLRVTSPRVDLASLRPIYDVFAPGFNDMDLHGDANLTFSLAWKTSGGYNATGTVEISSGRATVADLTLDNITGTLRIEADEERISLSTDDGRATLGESPVGFTVASSIDNKQAGLETLAIEAFDGTAQLNTQIQLEGSMPFTSDLTVRGMQLGPLIAAILPDTPLNITGTLASVDGSVQGTFDEDLMPSITGNIAMALTDGLIKEVNIGREALGAVTDIPFLAGTLLKAVPESFISFLEADHTVLESVTGSFRVADETLTTDDLKIQSDFFALDATGTIGFDTLLELESNIYFNRNFSSSMVDKVKEIAVLLDPDGRLTFPIKISGIPPDLRIRPDISKLLKKAIQGTVREKAGEVLKDLIGEVDQTSETPLRDRLRQRFNRNPQ